METIAGSPRSSSGYGSSEEDHGCFGLTTIRSTSSTPLTPESLSPLPSDPFGYDVNVDFQSVFEDDDVMPDFSDLGVIPDASELYSLADDWSAVTTPQTISCSPDSCSLLNFTAEDYDHVTQALVGEGNILASLLKQKSEFDWFTTAASTMTSDLITSGKSCSSSPTSCTVTSRTAFPVATAVKTSDCEPELVQSMTSPLQRLKALTQGSVVNNTELPSRPRIIINGSSSSSLASVKQESTASASSPSANAVIRVGVAGTSLAAAAVRPNRASPNVSASQSRGQPTTTRPPFFSVAATEPTTNNHSTSYTDCLPRKQSTPSVSTRPAPVAIRRTRSELDDHRYSSLLPVPMTPSNAVRRPNNSSGSGASIAKRANRSASAQGGGNTNVTIRASGGTRKTGSSMLETLLLTNRTLRPNEGSEASLAACGVWSSCRRSSGSIDAADEHLSVGGPQAKRTCSEAPGSLLEHLLTGRTDELSSSASTAETVIIKSEPIDEDVIVGDKLTAADGFGLFNEHLLYDDSHGINLGGLFGEEMSSTWTPACFDDRVLSTELEEIMHQEVRQEDAWLQHYLSDLL